MLINYYMFKKSVFLIIFLLILPNTGFTLGLGNITVFSNLNEPLKVSIELLNSKSTPLDEIIIKNASLNTYRRANLPRPDSFNQVRFKTKKESDGSISVELSTKRPVREPFITFIADLKWRTGHINREYTFLLDPPEFIKKQIYVKSPSKSKMSKTQKQMLAKKTPVLRTPRKVTHRKIDYSTVIANHIDGNTYKTKRADTLWGIAKKVRPNKNVTTYQTMQALFALNPNAFIKNNIDLLKEGQTLKIPTQNEILQVNGKAPPSFLKEASAAPARKKTVATISTLSKQQKTSQLPDKPADINTRPDEASSKKENGESKAQLKIIPPAEAILNMPVTSKKDLILINKALQNSITTIKSLQNENEILSDQINALTEKLNSLDSHNQGLNDKISDITVQLKKQQTEQINAQGTSKNSTQAIIADSKKKPSDDSGLLKTGLLKTDSLAIDSTLSQTGQSSSFIRELLTSPAITIALAICTIIILIAAFYTIRSQNEKRKQRKQNAYIPFPNNDRKITPRSTLSEPIQDIQIKSHTATSPSSLQGTDISDDKDEEDMDFFEYFEKKINASETDSTSTAAPKSKVDEASEIKFNLDISEDEIEAYEKSISNPKPTNTTLSEIDTYLAYGNYKEAEQRLISELQKVPSDKNLHLKLFECYTYTNKRYEFIQHAENNINLLNIDMVLRHRIENMFQQTWNEPLDINKFN